MKKFALLITLFLIPALCFAGGGGGESSGSSSSSGNMVASFEQRPSLMFVDLANTTLIKHDKNPSWEDKDTPTTTKSKYSVGQIICLASVIADKSSDSTKFSNNDEVTITINLLSSEWCYIYEGTDIRYMRPFGIRLIARGKKGSTWENIDEKYNLFVGEENGTTTASVTVPGSESKNYSSVYWDVLLEFENKIESDNTVKSSKDAGLKYHLIESDSLYEAVFSLTISVTNNGQTKVSNSSIINLKGYYGTAPEVSKDYCSLTISRLSGANNLSIRELYGSRTQTPVAIYSFTTASKSKSSNATKGNAGSVKLFLSSSSNIEAGSDEFILKHINSDGSEDASYNNTNSLKYTAYLVSDDKSKAYNSGDSTSAEVSFNGTGYAAKKGGSGTDKNSYIVKDNSGSTINYLEIVPTSLKAQTDYKYNFTSTGTITIEIPGNQTIGGQEVSLEKLEPGQYTSTIYIHVISDIS